jgi:hypothetical protein
LRELRAYCWQLLALLRDSAHMAGSHVRKSRKAPASKAAAAAAAPPSPAAAGCVRGLYLYI